MICKHDNGRWKWDCACSYGPPSCNSCHIRSECMTCKQLTILLPTVNFERPYDWKLGRFKDEVKENND